MKAEMTCACSSQKWTIDGCNGIKCSECGRVVPVAFYRDGVDVLSVNRYMDGIKRGVDTTECEQEGEYSTENAIKFVKAKYPDYSLVTVKEIIEAVLEYIRQADEE